MIEIARTAITAGEVKAKAKELEMQWDPDVGLWRHASAAIKEFPQFSHWEEKEIAYDERDVAKSLGYRWNPERGAWQCPVAKKN